jgi:hypothetical protein
VADGRVMAGGDTAGGDTAGPAGGAASVPRAGGTAQVREMESVYRSPRPLARHTPLRKEMGAPQSVKSEIERRVAQRVALPPCRSASQSTR